MIKVRREHVLLFLWTTTFIFHNETLSFPKNICSSFIIFKNFLL